MNKPAVFRSDGSPVSLGDRIGRGGEGEVYALANDKALAVKIYSGSGGADRRDKINAMVSAKLSDRTPLVAFPTHTVQKRNGEFAGFIMRKVNGHRPLFELYAPGARKSNFPHANYPFLVQTALNFANAVGAVHAAGCVIGDINHSGILIAENAIVSLIDADSFQLVDGTRRYLCRVGVPDYTPPELQGMKLNSVVRTPNHDNFGVAIVIFQLLFMGRHPFSGSYQRGEMPIEKAIGEHRFAYGILRNVGMKPPPAAPLLKHFPPQLGAAFEAAFGPGALRPEPRHWITLLKALQRDLQPCKVDPLHHYWRGSPECPWCRMERLQGISLFLPPQRPAAPSAADLPLGGTFKPEIIWRAIEAVSAPGPCTATPPLQVSSPAPSPEAEKLRGEIWKQRLTGGVAAAIAGAVLLASPGLWLVWVPAGWFGLAKLFGGDANTGKLRTRKNELDRRWNKALGDWRSRCGDETFAKAKAELHQAKTDYQGLAAEQTQRVLKYQQNRKAFQLQAYLATFYIRRAKISGIGPSKTATLASYGIETAADVTSMSRIERVPGFGPATAINLIAWRRVIEGRFVYNPNPNANDQREMNAIKADIAKKEAQLRHQLSSGPETLKKAAANALTLRRAVDPGLQHLHDEIAQAEADLAHIGAKPTVPGGWIAAIVLAILAVIALANADWSSPPPSSTPSPQAPLPAPVVQVPPPTPADAIPPPSDVTPDEVYSSTMLYAVRQTNVRARPTTAMPIVGKLDRASGVQGVIVAGTDGQKRWLKVTDGPYKGYYVSAAANLSDNARPELSTAYSGPKVVTSPTTVYREPSRDAPVLLDIPAGAKITVVGTTSDGLAEVSLKSGAIGYVDVGALGEPGSAMVDENGDPISSPAVTPADGNRGTPQADPLAAIFGREAPPKPSTDPKP
jgi:DNA-binding helix-hairpin-helix protein with protein kinase domain/uncharacterized protein YgiM (DUF1202 family)